jgi:quercetin dioxygenase-like cupin family protein
VIGTETVRPLRQVGRKLRGLRVSRGRSLAEVAEATDLSPSFLSLVETGKSDISIGRLVRLVQFYGVGLAELLPTEGERPEVVRSGQRRHVRSEAEGIDQYLLAPDANRTMMPVLVSYEPGRQALDPSSHPGEEWMHVLEGTMALDVEGSERVILNPGDSVYFHSDRPHSLSNVGDTKAWLVAAVTPPAW